MLHDNTHDVSQKHFEVFNRSDAVNLGSETWPTLVRPATQLYYCGAARNRLAISYIPLLQLQLPGFEASTPRVARLFQIGATEWPLIRLGRLKDDSVRHNLLPPDGQQ